MGAVRSYQLRLCVVAAVWVLVMASDAGSGMTGAAFTQASNSTNDGNGAVDELCNKCLTVVLTTNFDDLVRALMALATVSKHFPPAVVKEVLVISPAEEANILSAVIGSGSTLVWPFPVRFIPEAKLFGRSARELHKLTNGFKGKYLLQMAIKLWISRILTTDFYLTLDSDVLTRRDFTSRQLFVEPGKAVYVANSRGGHEQWWSATEEYLGLKGLVSNAPNALLFGVTPAVLATNISLLTVQHIEDTLGENLFPGLFEWHPVYGAQWTEYTAYRLVAAKHGLFDKYHGKFRDELDEGDFHDLYRGVWSAQDGKLDTHKCLGSVFCVIQSTTHIHPRDVYRSCSHFFVHKARNFHHGSESL